MDEMLNLAAGALLLTAVLVLWRRELAVIVRVFALQGVALAALVAVLAWEERSAELAAVAVGLLVLRGGVLPWLLRRALAGATPGQRESRPVLNVAASLLAAAALTLLALAVSAPLVELSPSPAARAVPIAVAVVLIGFLVLVTRRHAVSQLVGFLLMDNGITAAGVPHHRGDRPDRRGRGGARRPAGGAGAAGADRTDAGDLRRHRPRRAAGAARLMDILLATAPIVIPVLGAAVYALAGWRRATAAVATVSAVLSLLAVLLATGRVVATGPLLVAGLLRVDAVGAFMLLVITAIAVLVAVATPAHLAAELDARRIGPRTATWHAVLVQAFLAAMALAVTAADLGVLWVAVEATTIITAFLVGQRRTRAAVEAAWKYVVICSAGIALALLGIVVLDHASAHSGTGAGLDLAALADAAPQLDPGVTRIAVVLLIVGFGTKAGLAPLHAWLPDAHSQAPAPVSALMSGVLLSVAFYAVLRVKVIADGALGPGSPARC